MKNGIISEDLILEKVKEAIILALGVEEEEVNRDASLIDDLGAESIDFLDIAFRLERIFDIRLARGNVLEKAAEIFGEDAMIRDGVLTATALSLIKKRMPEVDPAKIKEGLTEEDTPTLFTIQTWVRAVDEVLKSLPEKCQQCGAKEFITEDNVKIKCKACGEPPAFLTGDVIMDEWITETHQQMNMEG